MEEHDAEKQLMREFKLNEQQAKFCILIASGKKGMDAVREVYTYASEPNYYGQLKKLVANPKIDSACKSLGMNLRDQFDKQAYAIVRAFEEIAYNDKVSVGYRLQALKELKDMNPMLQTMRKKDADDEEDSRLTKRVEEWLEEDE